MNSGMFLSAYYVLDAVFSSLLLPLHGVTMEHICGGWYCQHILQMRNLAERRCKIAQGPTASERQGQRV